MISRDRYGLLRTAATVVSIVTVAGLAASCTAPAKTHKPATVVAIEQQDCDDRQPPTQQHLGLTSRQLLRCIETLLASQDLPAAATEPFAATVATDNRYQRYSVRGLLGVVALTEPSGRLRGVDVFVFNGLRKRYGREPERRAQYAVLAALFPSAGADLEVGQRYYQIIDGYIREDGNRTVVRHDGIVAEALLSPVGVRYRFVPAG